MSYEYARCRVQWMSLESFDPNADAVESFSPSRAHRFECAPPIHNRTKPGKLALITNWLSNANANAGHIRKLVPLHCQAG